MVRLVLLLLLGFALLSQPLRAQTVLDTVCVGDRQVSYRVLDVPGSTFQWFIKGGMITAGNGTHEILVDWGHETGIFCLQVLQTHASGCYGDTMSAFVWIQDKPGELAFPTGPLKTVLPLDSSAETGVPIPYHVTVFVPNAFTPNSDGLNDIFEPITSDVMHIYMKILDRWGGIVYEGNGESVAWDGHHKGNIAPEGVYVYLIQAKGLDNKLYTYTGSLTVIR